MVLLGPRVYAIMKKKKGRGGTILHVPELGERVSRGILSGVLPIGSLVSFLVDVDGAAGGETESWNPDIVEPNSSIGTSKPWHLDSF